MVGAKRSVSTKLGTTSIAKSSGTSSFSWVAAASQAEGVVTASLARIEKRVSGRKLASLPTRVMSVPCRVVTTLGAAVGVSAASSARAR